jgi:methylglutamate dehydrogenase subunit B
MRILCPHCGERDVREFTYLGDATVARPDPLAEDRIERYVEYVFVRANPAGLHKEYWYHGVGCQQWLVVSRDTKTHQVLGSEFAAQQAWR